MLTFIVAVIALLAGLTAGVLLATNVREELEDLRALAGRMHQKLDEILASVKK